MDDGLLRSSLAVAVPLAIEEVRGLTAPEIDALRLETAQTIASKGDVILYRSKKSGESAKAFAMLARGLAILAFAPGGVTFLGDHWEASRG